MKEPITEKSQAANVILTFFLGPLGLLYAHPKAAVGLIITGPVLWFVITGSSGMNDIEAIFFGIIFYGFMEIISIVWGVTAINKHNREVAKYRDQIANDRHVEQLEAIEQAGKSSTNRPADTTPSVPQSKPSYY